MRRKYLRAGAVAAAVLVLTAAGAVTLLLSGNEWTVARCVVTEAGSVYMVYDGRPVLLTSLGERDYRTGDQLLILHASAFAESYPEQVRTVLTIRIGRGSRADIPADVMGILTGLGNRIE